MLLAVRMESLRQPARIRRPFSARDPAGGKNLVLFYDQSGNISRIDPYEIEFRLVTTAGAPFADLINEELDFTAAEVRVSLPFAVLPWAVRFSNWRKISFNR